MYCLGPFSAMFSALVWGKNGRASLNESGRHQARQRRLFGGDVSAVCVFVSRPLLVPNLVTFCGKSTYLLIFVFVRKAGFLARCRMIWWIMSLRRVGRSGGNCQYFIPHRSPFVPQFLRLCNNWMPKFTVLTVSQSFSQCKAIF